jgi:hypothetical protein
MKFCPICKMQYPEDANFCPQETCATPEGPQRLQILAVQTSSRFQPIERIGGGNTGEVWRAFDNQTGTEVAFKTIAADVLATPASLARAEREFKQLMRVSSPKIAAIVECEKTPAGSLHIAMELCQGDSLERILAGGPMGLEQAKSIVSQIGQALLEAQKVGLVHRDVAPKNILISPSGDVKVINFPIAKPINDRVAGVPEYLSPEQVQGKPVDQRSNTYSLAAILYHLLTGEPLFQGPSVQALLDMQVSTPVLPPTQRRPGANIPADADKLVIKALDKSSSRRHLTLRLFLNELEALKAQSAGATKAAGEVGLAKTMMFGGNQADIARMVAEARAAKAGGVGITPPPVAASPVAASVKPIDVGQTIAVGVTSPHAAPHIQPLATRAPGPVAGAVSHDPQTLVQGKLPVAAAMGPVAPVTPSPVPQTPSFSSHPPTTPAPYAPTPPPVLVKAPHVGSGPVAPAAQKPAHALNAQMARPNPAQQPAVKPAEAGKGAPPKAGAAFRETLWFKQGDVEQMVADARAKMQASGKPPQEAAALPEDSRPLEDRYVDDGSVTVEDRKKFSLRSGGTATALPTAGTAVPGKKMDESEIVDEISGGRRTMILIIAIFVILALIVVVVMMVKGKGKESSSKSGKTASAEVTSAKRSGSGSLSPSGEAFPFPSESPDADAVGSGAPTNKAAGSGLGSADGATKPGVGGAAIAAKSAGAGGKKAAKKKPVAKHPSKRKVK